jgi:hypothetical protein
VKAKYLVAIFIVILVYAVSLFYAGEKSLEELRKDPLNVVSVFGYVMIVTFETMFVLIIIEVLLAVGQVDECARSTVRPQIIYFPFYTYHAGEEIWVRS